MKFKVHIFFYVCNILFYHLEFCKYDGFLPGCSHIVVMGEDRYTDKECDSICTICIKILLTYTCILYDLLMFLVDAD